MSRELFVMRHGKSDRQANVENIRRPLKDRGKRGAQRMGVWLWQQDLLPDYVVTSPAERALVSAEKCCKASNLGTSIIHRDKRLFSGKLAALLQVLGDCPPAADRVLLVGHNPACEELIRYLVGTHPEVPHDTGFLKTAALARIDLPDDWKSLTAGAGTLRQVLEGRALPEKFPFPAPHGAEGRDRPAYYYQQSGVIPFRVRNGDLEILLVRSSKRNHWVVPKGVSGPGQTLQESACEEAREEAGVEGEVLNSKLGSYMIEKWGATCSVTIFPLRVSRVIPEEDWEEHHRGREWLSSAEAARRVQHPHLGAMIIALQAQLREE